MNAGSPLERLPTHERRLENGLTVLVREDHSAPVVAIVTHVKAGYFNEPDALVGISHVLEHMYFKGTERLGAGEIARATKSAGGYLSAGTIYDYTTYYTVLPSAALELGLEIQSDALRNSEIDPDELRRELEVIIEEAKRKLDNPNAVATETLYETMFDVHRIRRWRIGTEVQLRRLTREDVWRYYRELYRPSNIVLVVVGDVDPERTLELIEEYYGDMPPGEVTKEPAPEEPEREGLRYRELVGDVNQSYIAWGWRTPGTLDPDTPALDLLATVLGQGRASRLYRNVRERGLVSSISAYNYTPTEIGVFGISAEASPDETSTALEAIAHEVARIREDGIQPEELTRAKNILEARMLRRFETVEGQANLLADWQALGDWRLADRYLEEILSADVDDLRRVARRHLSLERATVLEYRPEGARPSGRDEGWWEGIKAKAKAKVEAGEVLGVGVEEVVGRGVGGGVGVRVEIGGEGGGGRGGGDAVPMGVEDGVHFYELVNGARLVIKPRHTSPLVSMGIVVRGGALHEPSALAGVTGLLARTSVKGTTTRDAATLAEETEAMGGAIMPTVGSDLLHWSLALPSRHFERGFALLADVVLRPSFPETELERERKVALSDLAMLRDDMYRYPMRLFLEDAFGDHPYGYGIGTKEAALRRLTREDVVRWHEEEVLAGRPLAIVVGDVDPDEAAALMAAELDAARGLPAPREMALPIWPERARTRAEQRSKAQTALVLGFPGPARNHPDSHVMQVMANAIGGLGGRLFEELRSRRSLAYTVAAYPITRWRAGAFVAYIGTSPEREDEARRGLIEEFDRLVETTLDPEEVERAKRYTIGAWKIRGQTNGAQLGDLAYSILLGDGLAELRTFEDRIRAVTPVAIREAMRRYYDPDRLLEAVVRGAVARQGVA